MAGFTRRDVLRNSAAVTAAAAVPRGAHAAQGGVTMPAATGDSLAPRERLLMDFGWRFHLGHAQDVARDFGFGANQHTFAKSGDTVASAAALDFDDHDWEAVDLPHDWAVALPFVPSANPPSKPNEDDPRAAHGYKPLGREFPETSVGWYRRNFDIPKSDEGRRISVEFDGVFRNALVLCNGYIVATNESGYVPFRADITDYVNYGGKNIIAVRVDATLGEGWFYEGAGLYRHVWLVKTAQVHIPQWGVAVEAVPAHGKAMVSIVTEVANDAGRGWECEVAHAAFDPDGRSVAESNAASLSINWDERGSVQHQIVIDAPLLWSLERPHLYTLRTEVRIDGKVIDRYATTFGIREFHFDPEKGFFLNGKHVKLYGACNHQDHAGVGSALPDRLQAYRIERMKEMGCNAYRTAHNPPAPELLDACDRLGMLVIDETRTMASSPEGLSQLERMIRRDRNHPSIILWSLGNEEQQQQGTERGARVIRDMDLLAHRLDPTRPVTAAMDHEFHHGIAPELDVIGFNYRTEFIDPHHKAFPKQPIIGTETGSTVCTRGIYARDDVAGYVPAYDTIAPWWATTAEAWWTFFAEREYCAGGFVWTAFDYRGEPTPFNRWPEISSHFGFMDTCGFPKDNYYYYRAWWKDEPLLHLFPHWNWQPGQSVDVWCHTNLDRVELFLNGRSLGVRDVARNRHIEWKAVAFEPGVIEARGYKGGVQAMTAKRETAGEAVGIRLTPDRNAIAADGEDVVVVAVEIVDAAGRVVPRADNEIAFSVSGGAVIGVGNGNPTSLEPDKAAKRRAFNGLCCAIVQAPKRAGAISIAASSPGLASASVTVTAAKAALRPAV